MNLRMKISWALAFTLLPLILWAQNTKPSSYIKSDYYSNFSPEDPKTSGLGSFGSTPINYYTQLPEISINLMTLSSRDLSIPISLNYDASGMRVDDISGSVGIKWNLDAGGYVARQKNGLPDEDPNNGYWKYKTELNATTIDINVWAPAAEKNLRDTEPDEFVANLGGRTIRFWMKDMFEIVTLPYQKVIITPTRVNGKLTAFEIVTEDGIKYKFGGTSESTEERQVETLNMVFNFNYEYKNDTYEARYEGFNPTEYRNVIHRSFFSGNPVVYRASATERIEQPYNSKWYLIQMSSPAGDQINFAYQKTGNSKYVTQPTLTRREPVLKNINEGYTYNENVCVTYYFGACNDHQIRTFTHTWKTPAFATYTDACPDYVTNCNNGYATDVPQSSPTAYFDPKVYSLYDNYLDAISSNQSLITESVIKLLSIATSAGNSISLTNSIREDFPNSFKYDKIQQYNVNNQLVKTIDLDYETKDASSTMDNMSLLEGLLVSRMSGLPNPNPSPSAADVFLDANHIKDLDPLLVNRVYTGDDNPSALNNVLKKYPLEGLKGYNYKRLFLKSVRESFGTASKLINAFEYNSTTRRRVSPNQTAYGFETSRASNVYYNLNSAGTMSWYANIVSPYDPSISASGTSFTSTGRLKKIIYPTGGYTSILYSGNLTIEDYASSGTIVSSKEVEATNVIANSPPVFVSYENNLRSSSPSLYQRFKVTTSYAQNRSFTSSARFRNVRVYNGTKTTHIGYEDFVFKSDADDLNPIYAIPKDKNVSGTEVDNITVDAFPFPKRQDKDHIRGQLEKHIVYDKANNILLEQENTYTINPYGFVPGTLKLFTAGSFDYNGGKKYRYARPTLIGDWVALTKKTERIYDQQFPGDISKSTARITDLTYNSTTLGVSQSKTYAEAKPTLSNITKTKYVNDYYYEYIEGMPMPSSEVTGLLQLNNNNQISTPVEVQNLIEDNGVSKLLSATIYTYAKVGNFQGVRPLRVLGTQTILGTTGPSGYQPLSINQATGVLVIDSHLRQLHSYDTYNSTGNITLQSTMDGISSFYVWDTSNTMVNSSTASSGTLSQTTSYVYSAGVGVTSTTDPNSITTSFEYGRFNRLKHTKDKDSNILTRYRYNYAGDGELSKAINKGGIFIKGQAVTLSSPDNVEFGQTQYEWNFGDGSKSTSALSSANHPYANAGTYAAYVNKNNPEYAPLSSDQIMVSIYEPGTAALAATGPTYINNCSYVASYDNPLTFTATVTNGCPGTFHYNWEWKKDSGSWTHFGGDSNIINGLPPYGFCSSEGTYTVRCTVTDGCNYTVSVQSNLTLIIEKTTPNCPCSRI